MKKFITIFVVIAMVVSGVLALTACNNKNTDDFQVKIIVPDGAPALALAKLLKDTPSYDGYQISYEIVPGAAEISAKMLNGEATLGIVPTNIAANLYNGKGIKLISTNTHGLLYLVGISPAESLADLKGKVVYNIGRGGTPDITFKYILEENGLEWQESETADVDGKKVSLHYVGSGAELIPLLKTGTAKYGILGEPAATQAMGATGANRLFDIQAEWNKVVGTQDNYPQASLVGQSSFLTNEHKEFVKWLLVKLEENVEWIKEHPSQANIALVNNGSQVKSDAFTTEIIERCNISVVHAKDAKKSVMEYLTIIYEFNDKAVGGKLPDDNFFYLG